MSLVVFDVFGTLIHYAGQRVNPYRHLVGKSKERLPFLTRNASVDAFASELGLDYMIPMIRRQIDEEIAALRLFADVACALQLLRSVGTRIGVCSNLAAEYGTAVRRLLPFLDAYIFSYEVAAKKPEPKIYEAVRSALHCKPEDILFIGDSMRTDVVGPQAYGMQARLIDRKAGQTLLDVLQTVTGSP